MKKMFGGLIESKKGNINLFSILIVLLVSAFFLYLFDINSVVSIALMVDLIISELVILLATILKKDKISLVFLALNIIVFALAGIFGKENSSINSLLFFFVSSTSLILIGLFSKEIKNEIFYKNTSLNLVLIIFSYIFLILLLTNVIKIENASYFDKRTVVSLTSIFVIALSMIRFIKSHYSLFTFAWVIFPSILIFISPFSFYKLLFLGLIFLFLVRAIFEKRSQKKIKIIGLLAGILTLSAVFSLEIIETKMAFDFIDIVSENRFDLLKESINSIEVSSLFVTNKSFAFSGSNFLIISIVASFGLLPLSCYLMNMIFMVKSTKNTPWYLPKFYFPLVCLFFLVIILLSFESSLIVSLLFIPLISILLLSFQHHESRLINLRCKLKFLDVLKIDMHVLNKRIYCLKETFENKNNFKIMYSALPLFLKDGTFYVHFYKKEINQNKSLFSKKITVKSEPNGFKLDSINYNEGRTKNVVLTKNKCFCLYDSSTFETVKETIKSIDKLMYPHADILEILDDKKIIVMERVIGKSFSDAFHDKAIIEDLIKNIRNNKIIEENGIYLQYQHADYRSSNIIWENETNYKCIDLDYCTYLPVYSDLIKYILDECSNIAHLEEEIDKYDDLKNDLKALFGSSNNYLDDLLANYVNGIKEKNTYKVLLYYIAYMDLTNYPKTKASLPLDL